MHANETVLETLSQCRQRVGDLEAELTQVRQSAGQTRDDSLLLTVAQVTNLLLRSQNYQLALPEVMRLLGEAVGSDRCAIGQDQGIHPTLNKPFLTMEVEWCKSGVLYSSEFSPHPDQVYLWEDAPHSYRKLLQCEVVNCLVADLPEPDRGLFEAQGNLAELFVPILVHEQFWGFIAFDNCGEPRLYDEAEIAILRIAADSIAAAIERQINDNELQKIQQILLQAEKAKTAELARINEELGQRERLLSATGTVANILLAEDNFDQAVDTALQILGESLKTDRTKVLEGVCEDEAELEPTHFAVTYEWTTPGTISQLTHPTSSTISIQGAKKFTQRFFPDDGFSGLLEEWDESLHSAFEAVGAKAIHAVPIRVDGKFWGVFAFDDCREAKQRSVAELAVLKMAANCIGSAIERQRTQKALLEAEQQRVTELAKTNQALKNSLDRLAAEPNLEAFLGHVLTEISQQLEMHTAWLFLYDPQAQTLRLNNWVDRGNVRSQQHFADLEPLTEILLDDNTPIWTLLLQTKFPFVITQENAAQFMFPGIEDWQIQWSDRHGIRSGINILLSVGDKPLGLLAILSTHRSEFTREELELVQALSQQATLAIQLTQLAAEAQQAAILEERNRLAGEIHDTLAQTFTGISVQLELVKYLIPHQEPTEISSILDRIGSLAQTGISETRRSVWSVYPFGEEHIDLAQQLTDCVEQLTCGTELTTQFEIDGNPQPLSSFLSTNLLRIGQVSIANTLKHAQASQLSVKLTYTPMQVSLCIKDNGCGFNPQAQTEGFGLISISERTDRIGGQLRITTQPSQGTEIFVQVPL
jgi:signal transduction histidine kinase